MAGDWAEYQMGQRQIQENQMPSQAYGRGITTNTPHAGIPSSYMYQNVFQNVFYSPQEVQALKHPNRAWLDSVITIVCAKGRALYA